MHYMGTCPSIVNAVYSANEDVSFLLADYQEISSGNPTPRLGMSETHYETADHTYELGTDSSTDVSYYAEVGPLLDVVSLLCNSRSYCSYLHNYFDM